MTEPSINVNHSPMGGPYRCPCCGYLTLAERGLYEICPVCFWEDDGQDDHDADRVRGGPNGRLSLTEARQNFHAIGASDQRRTQFVREPLSQEHPLS
ncbi:CPCC family cysteine-rich protein [Streptomyces sp. NPDC001401]|uniref:CPCC family cysteine-rich protein n=1 Tax=Streptomyces sp. NPDC001401 TaxID=3364570 RepID=UPI0036A3A2B3